MRHLKMLGPIVLAALALAAFAGAGTASAAVLCKNNLSTTACSEDYAAGTELKAALKGANLVYHGFVGAECSAHGFSGKTKSTGGSTETVRFPVEFMTQNNCGTCTPTVLKLGELEVHHLTGTNDGTVTSTGTEVTTACQSIFGPVHCIYRTENSHVGTLKGGNPARLVVNGTMPIVSTSEFCGVVYEEEEVKWKSAIEWTGEYEFTQPKPLYVTSG